MHTRLLPSLVLAALGTADARGPSCPGHFRVGGHGHVSIVPAGWVPETSMGAGANVDVLEGRTLVPHMGSRAYFADTCTAGKYDHRQYIALPLLGKRLRYMVDLSGVGCGCNVAFYLTSLRQNRKPSTCSDYYCDANSVCGEACAEIDIQEASQHAWHSTLHSAQDGNGVAAGYGGGGIGWSGPRDWTSAEYGPGARCIDTSKPFQVDVTFPTDAQGSLRAMEVKLSQRGHSCPLSMSLDSYYGMAELSKALSAGMTPIVSYWKSDDMRWLDGEGSDMKGPCRADAQCVDSAKLYHFSVRGIDDDDDDEEDEEDSDGDTGEADEDVVPTTATASLVKEHGALRVEGNLIVGESGKPVRLRGMSLFWSQWMSQYWNGDIVKWLRDDFHATLVRAAMGVEMGGYLENPRAEKKHIETVVKACIDAGIYVIVDWHDHHASAHVEQSKGFFDYMAGKYGHYPNVMFEIWNEPMEQDWAGEIKPYHEQIVPVIRKHTQNLIICGTRQWSQEVDVAAMNPVPGKNIAYTVHFYAASHGQPLRDRINRARSSGVAVFITEWGTCEASGDGALNLQEAQAWLDFNEANHISDANWAISDKNEACSALRDGASGRGAWKPGQLTDSGSFVRSSIRRSLPVLPTVTITTTTTTTATTTTAAAIFAVASGPNLVFLGEVSAGGVAAVMAIVAACAVGFCLIRRSRPPPKEEISARALSTCGSSSSLKPSSSQVSLKPCLSNLELLAEETPVRRARRTSSLSEFKASFLEP